MLDIRCNITADDLDRYRYGEKVLSAEVGPRSEQVNTSIPVFRNVSPNIWEQMRELPPRLHKFHVVCNGRKKQCESTRNTSMMCSQLLRIRWRWNDEIGMLADARKR